MKNIGLKLYAGIQAVLLSGVTLATFSACNDKTEQVATQPIEVIVDVDTPQETTTYEAFDTTTAKTETTKKTTTTKVYTTEVQDETTKRGGSIETTVVKDNKDDNKNNNVNSDNANNNVNSGNTDDNYVDDNNYVDNNSNNRDNSNNNVRDNSNNNVRDNSGNNGRGNNNQNPQTQPPVTQPPVTQPPVTEPPVTQPPVTEPPVTQPPLPTYNLNDISYDYRTLDYFTDEFKTDLMYIPGYMVSEINMPYGSTNGYVESAFIISALNYQYVNDNVLSDYFSFYPQYVINYSMDFMCSYNMVQNTIGNDVDFSKYTIDINVGNYLNEVDNAYRRGENINLNYLDNPGVCGILRSYGYDVNIENVNEFANRVSRAAYGTQLTFSNSNPSI